MIRILYRTTSVFRLFMISGEDGFLGDSREAEALIFIWSRIPAYSGHIYNIHVSRYQSINW